MVSVLSIQFDLTSRDSALVCSWIYESNGMHHGCPRTRMIFCLMSGDSTSRDFALICSCSSKTGVKFNDRYIIEHGGKSAKHDSPIRAICIVKPWNPWPRSFSTIWDAIEERRRVVRGNVTQSLITSTSTAIPIYLSLGRNIFHYHSSRYHSNGPVEGLAHYAIRYNFNGSVYYAFTWPLCRTHIQAPFTMPSPDSFDELISKRCSES